MDFVRSNDSFSECGTKQRKYTVGDGLATISQLFSNKIVAMYRREALCRFVGCALFYTFHLGTALSTSIRLEYTNTFTCSVKEIRTKFYYIVWVLDETGTNTFSAIKKGIERNDICSAFFLFLSSESLINQF